MIREDDKTDLMLIDFEYAMLNFRGYDIAEYLFECIIDYTYSKPPFFRLYPYKSFYSTFEKGEI